MSVAVGEVISVRGVNIVIELYDESNKQTLFFEGQKYKGVSIREHLLIRRGFRDIVALVQGEYLDERNMTENVKNYVRRVELKPIGYYDQNEFYEGIKYLPMIRDTAFLMSESQVKKIYGEPDDSFVVGELLKEELPLSLPWRKLFNTHIGVFGNTGSGKSNTLAKLFTTLFNNKLEKIIGRSNFIVVDFNGEYTADQLISNREHKKVIDLDTKTDKGGKFILDETEFWDAEVFGILFKATENTQKPFLKRVVDGRERFKSYPDSLKTYAQLILEKALTSTSPKKEFSELIREIANICSACGLESLAKRMSWHGSGQKFYINLNDYLNGGDQDLTFNNYFKPEIESIDVSGLTVFNELKLRITLRLLSDLIGGFIQFEHIQPLLKRMEVSLKSLERVLEVGENHEDYLLTVISLRKTNQEIKKIIPLLLAKYYYNKHKKQVLNSSPPNRTTHLIVDEAHNILSMQSMRENESWKDYRLELFEEIIKEGRKFGFYLTLSSQRPADISPTIMSQIHNFFIHRLVNERDLFLLENTISTLDTLSKSLIPSLAKGCAIVTGVSFDIPMVVQFSRLPSCHQPDSDDVNLAELWS